MEHTGEENEGKKERKKDGKECEGKDCGKAHRVAWYYEIELLD